MHYLVRVNVAEWIQNFNLAITAVSARLAPATQTRSDRSYTRESAGERRRGVRCALVLVGRALAQGRGRRVEERDDEPPQGEESCRVFLGCVFGADATN